MKTYIAPKFKVTRDENRCIQCQVCCNQCSFDAHYYDAEEDKVKSREENCVGCHRCAVFCPTRALTITYNPPEVRGNYNWRPDIIEDINKQAETGGVLLTGMGDDKSQRIYWDHLVLNASQVTNPSIDPLREPMELTTYLGRKPERLELEPGTHNLKTKMTPLVKLEVPVMFAAMSYGAVSLNVQESLARAATEMGTLWNTGEGGLHPSLYKYGNNTIVQVASGRFGVHADYLHAGRIVEIKIGQGAKPGIGGHLPGEKVSADVSLTRMIPEGTDALSPAPQHDIYSIEDLAQLIYALKEATNYTKPISVKIAAVHNAAAIASGIVRGGADIVVIDGLRGATGAAPKVIRDNVGIPIELALASVDNRLRQEGIRHQASLVVSGGIRGSGDVAKAIALGADAVYIGTAALISLGCHVCQQCHTGKCPWGICTSDLRLTKRVNPEIGARRAANLLRGWSIELKDILGGLGVNALESLRGNRLHLRAIGLNDNELDVLGSENGRELAMTDIKNSIVNIDAIGVYYKELNARLRESVANGTTKIELRNVYGQRYIGTDLNKPVEIEIFGTPGNDLGAFMNGPRIIVHGNAQDGCGNTMNEGEIIVHGHAGDIVGLSARGGKIFIREDVGYRAGIHMKEYQGKRPVVVIGGTAQDFFGEYMAGGVLILLGLNLGEGQSHKAKYIGTGMHGGVIYIRGNISDYQLGKEVGVADLDEKDRDTLRQYVAEFAAKFDYDVDSILNHKFIKLFPRYLRPYGRLYAY